MLRNYLTIAVRHLRKHTGYAFISITGLAIGLAFCLLTFLFVRNEWTYDAFHEQADQIYRVNTERLWPEGDWRAMSQSSNPLGPVLAEAFPEVLQSTRLSYGSYGPDKGAMLIPHEAGDIRVASLFADSSFFDLFSFPLKWGHPSIALRRKDAIVLSQETAQIYFGHDNPVGQRLTLRPLKTPRRTYDFVVTGVAASIPENSTIRFDVLMPYERASEIFGLNAERWMSYGTFTYVRLADHAQPAALEQKLIPLVEAHMRRSPGQVGDVRALRLQPLTAMYLDPSVEHIEPVGNPVYTYILSGIALLVLLIACINFMNLSVGRSSARAKEVGVRKVLGARRGQLMKQFWSEALLMSGLALVLGLVLAWVFLPTFNALVEKDLSFAYVTHGGVLLFLSVLVLVVGLIAGSYPAVVLSGVEPVAVLKGTLKVGGGRLFSRSLVVAQFTLSIFLMVSAVVMLGQLKLLKKKNLGFNDDQVVVVDLGDLPESDDQRPSIDPRAPYLNSLSQHPGIRSASLLRYDFDRPHYVTVTFPSAEERNIYAFYVGYQFLETLEIDLIAGRYFSEDFGADATEAVMVNEALVRQFGWEAPLDEILPVEYIHGAATFSDPQVIGVVKDFHFQSLHHAVEPVALFLNLSPEVMNYLFARLSPDHLPETLAYMEAQWHEVDPYLPFDYFFLDAYLDRQYRTEEQWSTIVSYATFFAILIACLGAFGLTALAVTHRTKEIGIRKVLGASVSQVVVLLSSEFVKLLLVANILAWPLAYVAMDRWLQGFVYRFDLGLGTFALTGAAVLVMVLLAVGAQTIKAALANPVRTLRYE